MFSDRQGKIERGAIVWLGFGPHPPAMARNNPLDGRQANAATLEFICGMETLKGAEELLGMLHVESDPIVAHEIDIFSGSFFITHFDHRGIRTAGELDRSSIKDFETPG